MNSLDKAIGYFSPEWAFRRAQFRHATESFAYDGAKTGRRGEGWVASAGDANTEVGASLINLRDRSRDLLRNNPYASKAITELVGNAVGTGIVPQAKTGTPALDKIIDGEWPYFAENCDPGGQLDFYGMQALIVRTTAESGDGIVRFRPAACRRRLPRAAPVAGAGRRLPRHCAHDEHGQRAHHRHKKKSLRNTLLTARWDDLAGNKFMALRFQNKFPT